MTTTCDGLVCTTNVAETTFRYVDCEKTPTTTHAVHGRTRHLCAACVGRYVAPVLVFGGVQ